MHNGYEIHQSQIQHLRQGVCVKTGGQEIQCYTHRMHIPYVLVWDGCCQQTLPGCIFAFCNSFQSPQPCLLILVALQPIIHLRTIQDASCKKHFIAFIYVLELFHKWMVIKFVYVSIITYYFGPYQDSFHQWCFSRKFPIFTLEQL